MMISAWHWTPISWGALIVFLDFLYQFSFTWEEYYSWALRELCDLNQRVVNGDNWDILLKKALMFSTKTLTYTHSIRIRETWILWISIQTCISEYRQLSPNKVCTVASHLVWCVLLRTVTGVAQLLCGQCWLAKGAVSPTSSACAGCSVRAQKGSGSLHLNHLPESSVQT